MISARTIAAACCGLLLVTGAARAQGAPAQPADEVHRDHFFDQAVSALADGNLEMAARFFAVAAELPGDPARRAVAAAFVVRVRELEATRAAALRARRRGSESSNVPFLVTTTVLGLGLYGWAVPVTAGLAPGSSTRPFVGLYMLTAAASFAVPFFITRQHPVTSAQANLTFYGGTRGPWHGLLVASLVAGDLTPDRREQAWAASLAAGSLVELVAGYHLAPALSLTAGEVRTMAAVGDFGLLAGFGMGYLLGFDEKPSLDSRARGMAAAGLIGAGLGLTGGYVLGKHRRNSWGDGEVLRAATGVGVWLGAAVTDVASVGHSLTEAPFTLLLMGGGVVGLVIGDQLVRNAEFSVGASLVVDLATVAGGLLGAGVTYLASRDDGPYLFASALGGALGFTLAYWAEPGRTAGRGDPLATTLSLGPLLAPRGGRGLALTGRF